MTLRPFRFVPGPNARYRHFKLVVHARTRRAAQQYVRDQALSSIPHRGLKYDGEGHPSHPDRWTAAVVRSSVQP